MKVFQQHELREALAYAAQGSQAVHLHRLIGNPRRAPRCFIRALARGEQICHLFDQDVMRLTETASRLGVRVVVVERRDQPTQHIDLCGAPLRRALAEVE